MKRTAATIILALLPTFATAQEGREQFAFEETKTYMFARLCPFGDLEGAYARLQAKVAQSDNLFVQAFYIDTIESIIETTRKQASFIERARVCAETAM